MNNFAIFIAAYWKQAEESGDTVHWGDAVRAFHIAMGSKDYDFLRPYYDSIEERTKKLLREE